MKFGINGFNSEIRRRNCRPIFNIRVDARETWKYWKSRLETSPHKHGQKPGNLYGATKFPAQTFPKKADSARWKKQAVDSQVHRLFGRAAEGTEVNGEHPQAHVVRSAVHVTVESILAFMEKRLSAHKRLSVGIVFTDAIPKSPSGKILRRMLKDPNMERSSRL